MGEPWAVLHSTYWMHCCATVQILPRMKSLGIMACPFS